MGTLLLYLVKTVYWAQIPESLLLGQDVEEAVEPVVTTGMDRPGGGFVHHQHLLVLMDDLHL